jgi:hypothetical protein
VYKTRIGGWFWSKTGSFLEYLCSLLTIRQSSVGFISAGKEEFNPPFTAIGQNRFKVGVMKSGRIKAIEMDMNRETPALMVCMVFTCAM